MRRLCSGKTLAFQAKDAGSIPARRSNYTLKGSSDRDASTVSKRLTFWSSGLLSFGVGKVAGMLSQKKRYFLHLSVNSI